MTVTKFDTSKTDSLLTRDDSEVDKHFATFFYSRAQHVNRSTYSDFSGVLIERIQKQIGDVLPRQMQIEFEVANVLWEDSNNATKEHLFYPEVMPQELGQKIKSRNRQKLKANLKKVNKVKQSKIDSDLANFIDL